MEQTARRVVFRVPMCDTCLKGTTLVKMVMGRAMKQGREVWEPMHMCAVCRVNHQGSWREPKLTEMPQRAHILIRHATIVRER